MSHTGGVPSSLDGGLSPARPITGVVAALVWEEGRFLICQRPAHKATKDLRSSANSLCGRSRKAERRRNPWWILSFSNAADAAAQVEFAALFFEAAIREGRPQRLEHNALRWIAPCEIGGYDFCPADTEILARLAREEAAGR